MGTKQGGKVRQGTGPTAGWESLVASEGLVAGQSRSAGTTPAISLAATLSDGREITDCAMPSEERVARGPRFVRNRPRRIAVSLVVPALNEGQNIGWVLERIPGLVDEVILVDGDSTDDTIAISREIRPDILVLTQGQPGKGAALRAGFEAARGEVVVMIDADRSMDPAEIERFVECIRAGHDLVKGSRFIEGGGTKDMERTRRIGNGVLKSLVNVLYRAEFSDLCYGYVAFRRDRLEDLALTADGFEIEAEIVCRALRAGLKIAEVPSFEAPRAYGESNLNTWRDGTRVLRTLLRHRAPRRSESDRPTPALPAAAGADA